MVGRRCDGVIRISSAASSQILVALDQNLWISRLSSCLKSDFQPPDLHHQENQSHNSLYFNWMYFSGPYLPPTITLPYSVLEMPMKVRSLGAKPDPGFLYGAASQFPPRQKSHFLCITIWICGAAPLIIRRQSFGFRLFHKSYFHSSSGIVFPVRGQFGICVAATFESL